MSIMRCRRCSNPWDSPETRKAPAVKLRPLRTCPEASNVGLRSDLSILHWHSSNCKSPCQPAVISQCKPDCCDVPSLDCGWPARRAGLNGLGTLKARPAQNARDNFDGLRSTIPTHSRLITSGVRGLFAPDSSLVW